MHQRTPLRAVLEAEGRKQSWLAAKVGIDAADLSRIVKGMPVSPAQEAAIAVALGHPVLELFPAHVGLDAPTPPASDDLERSTG